MKVGNSIKLNYPQTVRIGPINVIIPYDTEGTIIQVDKEGFNFITSFKVEARGGVVFEVKLNLNRVIDEHEYTLQEWGI